MPVLSNLLRAFNILFFEIFFNLDMLVCLIKLLHNLSLAWIIHFRWRGNLSWEVILDIDWMRLICHSFWKEGIIHALIRVLIVHYLYFGFFLLMRNLLNIVLWIDSSILLIVNQGLRIERSHFDDFRGGEFTYYPNLWTLEKVRESKRVFLDLCGRGILV